MLTIGKLLTDEQGWIAVRQCTKDRRENMLLKQKNAVIFGAGGAVGTAVAKEFRMAAFLASDGARTLTGAILKASSGRVID